MQQKVPLTYRIMLVMGFLLRNEDGLTPEELESRIGQIGRPTISNIVNELLEAGMAEKSRLVEKRPGRTPEVIKLTEKGRRYAERYDFGRFADDPFFIPLHSFK